MNRRQTKKELRKALQVAEPRVTIESQFSKLNELALKVNNETKYCMFVNYSGHVDHVDIQICPSKDRYTDTIVNGKIKTKVDRWTTEKQIIDHFQRTIDVLEEILDGGKIPYDMLQEGYRQEVEYTF